MILSVQGHPPSNLIRLISSLSEHVLAAIPPSVSSFPTDLSSTTSSTTPTMATQSSQIMHHGSQDIPEPSTNSSYTSRDDLTAIHAESDLPEHAHKLRWYAFGIEWNIALKGYPPTPKSKRKTESHVWKAENDLFAAPATSAEFERVFSRAGRVLDSRRPRTYEELGEATECLRAWI